MLKSKIPGEKPVFTWAAIPQRGLNILSPTVWGVQDQGASRFNQRLVRALSQCCRQLPSCCILTWPREGSPLLSLIKDTSPNIRAPPE